MSADSKIEWTDHSFNPWWGCVQISPACDGCYALAFAKRVGQRVWGSSAPRRFFGEKHWSEPLSWDRKAEELGARHRVFCASMADVFEHRPDLPLDAARAKLWKLIKQTPRLDWLLLTKRPWNVERMVPWGNEWPQNVWLGVTVENQKYARVRVPHLLRYPAAVRFLSVEPLLGPLDLAPYLDKLQWVIAGGESGGRARPMQPEWIAGVRDQCAAAGVAFFFKQWGNYVPSEGGLVRVRRKDHRDLDGRTWDDVPPSVQKDAPSLEAAHGV